MKLLFLLKEGFRGYRTSKLSFFLTVFTCFLAISLLGIFSYIFLNANLLVDDIENRIEVEVFIDDSLSTYEASEIYKMIRTQEEVEFAVLTTKEEAKKKFIRETGINFETALDFNPLPASIMIKIKEIYRQGDKLLEFKNRVSHLPGVNDIVYNKNLLETIQKRAELFRLLLLIIFLIVTLATVYLISNTIKLNMYNRIDDINTMRLVGATKRFIRLPFILEGILVGAIGGIFAAILITAVEFSFEYLFGIKSYLRTGHLLLLNFFLILSSIIFGYFGSQISIRKFFRKTELYF